MAQIKSHPTESPVLLTNRSIKWVSYRILSLPAMWEANVSHSWHKPFNNRLPHHLQHLALSSIVRSHCLFTRVAWSLSYTTDTFLWWSAKRSFTQRPYSSVSYCAVSGRLQPGSKQMADCHNYISESEAQRSESSLESVTERPLRAALDVYSCSHPRLRSLI